MKNFDKNDSNGPDDISRTLARCASEVGHLKQLVAPIETALLSDLDAYSRAPNRKIVLQNLDFLNQSMEALASFLDAVAALPCSNYRPGLDDALSKIPLGEMRARLSNQSQTNGPAQHGTDNEPVVF